MSEAYKASSLSVAVHCLLHTVWTCQKNATTHTMFTTLSSCALHAPGSFFFYPWKPLLQFVLGDSYEVAYQYFRRDHSGGANAALHLVALGWTMLANFGLLFLADQYFFPTQLTIATITGSTSRALANATLPPLPLSYLTAVAWIICLMCSPAPIECSSLATALVGAVYLAAPHMTAHQLELGAVTVFVTVLLLVRLLAPRLSKGSKGGPELRLRGHTSIYFGLFALGLRLAARQWRGAWAAEAPAVNAALLLLMLGASSLSKPTVPCVLLATLLGRVAAELTAQDGLLLYCSAFAAQAAPRPSTHRPARRRPLPVPRRAWRGACQRAPAATLASTRPAPRRPYLACPPSAAGVAGHRARRLLAEGHAAAAPGRPQARPRAHAGLGVVAHALLPQPTARPQGKSRARPSVRQQQREPRTAQGAPPRAHGGPLGSAGRGSRGPRSAGMEPRRRRPKRCSRRVWCAGSTPSTRASPGRRRASSSAERTPTRTPTDRATKRATVR